MCGIAAFFAKDPDCEKQLGKLFRPMLECLTSRGPDSAGFALYRNSVDEGMVKIVAQHPDLNYSWNSYLNKLGSVVSIQVLSTHVISVLRGEEQTIRAQALGLDQAVTLMSMGRSIEIFKEIGLPCAVMERFNLGTAEGSHIIGHTRMATESAVTTAGSHPFSTGMDLCLVHNGSLSNHNRLRRNLQRQGISFSTDNDSEVAAGYLAWRLRGGDSLPEALGWALKDLDGFYTFAIGTRDGFAVLRDPVACKPAILAETDRYVAMASEYRALAHLPDIEKACIWEPEPAKIYTWSKAIPAFQQKVA